MDTESQKSNTDHINPLDLIKFDLNENEIDLDEINLDDLSFKPVNKGLGFHHESKKSFLNKRPYANVASSSVSGSTKTPTFNKRAGNSFDSPMIENSDISEFYKDKKTNPAQSVQRELKTTLDSGHESKSLDFKEATLGERFGAFLIDFLVLSGFVVLVFGGIMKFLFNGVHFFKAFSSLNEISLIGFLLFGILFIAYFSFMELFTTPGKVLLNLEVVRVDGKKLGLKDTIVRSVISFLSILLFFMPLILRFQDRLSETKVVKK